MAFEPLTYEDLVQLWREIFPRSYTVPMEAEFNGQGFDAFSQQARIFAEAAEAVAVTQQVYYKLPHSTQIRPQAMSGRQARGEVLLSRTQSALGQISINPGTLLEATVRGTRGEPVRIGTFRTLSGAVLSPGSNGPITVVCECTREGYQGNVAPGSITSFVELGRADSVVTVSAGNVLTDNGLADRLTEDMVGRYLTFVTGPNASTTPRKILSAAPLGQVTVDGPALVNGPDQVIQVLEYDDLGLVVGQPEAFSGGRHAWLDAIGAERGIYRQDGETDEQFVLRICFLADSITPGAVERLCNRILGACGICCRIIENGDATSTFIYDLPVDLAPDIRSPWDDPDAPGNGVVWNSRATQTKFLTIYVGCGNAGEVGFAYDASPFAPLNDNAWDWPEVGGFQESPPVWDGFPAGVNACIGSFIDALRTTLAAGVGFQIIKDCSLDCGCVPAP